MLPKPLTNVVRLGGRARVQLRVLDLVQQSSKFYDEPVSVLVASDEKRELSNTTDVPPIVAVRSA